MAEDTRDQVRSNQLVNNYQPVDPQQGMDLSGNPYPPGADPTTNKTPPGFVEAQKAVQDRLNSNPVGPKESLFPTPGGAYAGAYGPITNAIKNLPDYVHSLGNSSPSAGAPASAPITVSPSLSQPRESAPAGRPVMYGNDGRGNAPAPLISGSGLSGIPEGASGASPVPGSGFSSAAPSAGSLTTEQANLTSRAQLDAMNASNRQRQENFVNTDAARAREDATRPSSVDVARAEGDARAARFRATDGADIVLAGNNPMYADQRKAIVQNAAEATQHANALQAQRALPSAVANTPSNFIQNAAAAQAAGQSAQKAGQDQAVTSSLLKRGALEQEGLGLDNAGKKAHIDAVNELQAAGNDPQKQALAERKLLAIAGKTEPGWKAAVIPGGFDPETGGQRASSVLYYNQFTNQSQLLGGQGESLAGGNAKPPAGWLDAAKKANPGMSEAQLLSNYKPR